MHEMQTIVTDDIAVSVSQSVRLSRGSTRRRVQRVRGHTVQPLPNHVGLLLLFSDNSFATSGCGCTVQLHLSQADGSFDFANFSAGGRLLGKEDTLDSNDRMKYRHRTNTLRRINQNRIKSIKYSFNDS